MYYFFTFLKYLNSKQEITDTINKANNITGKTIVAVDMDIEDLKFPDSVTLSVIISA